MSIVLQGSTSGSITLQEPAIAGSNTINLPAATGTMALLQIPSFATTIGVGGATAAASGAGITFPATQSASSDANTLDDYEEGTWTPSFGGQGSDPTITYGGNRLGSYTKIGRLVYVTCRLPVATISGGSGQLEIRGLPFTVTTDATFPAFSLGYKTAWATNGPDYGRFLQNSTKAEIWKSNNTGETGITVANLQAGTEAIFTGCYYT